MKYLIFCGVLFTAFYSVADAPGNKPRPDYDVTISGLRQYAGYTFYYQENEATKILKDSNNIDIQGGYGAPMCVSVWAVQNKTKQPTDTLYFCSGESEEDKSVVILIAENHLSVAGDTATAIIIENSIPYVPSNQFNDTASVKNRNIMYFISGISFLILVMLVFFVWNKNRKSKIQKPQ